MAQAHFCSVVLTAFIDEWIRLLEYTETLRNVGAPRVGFTRGGLGSFTFFPSHWLQIEHSGQFHMVRMQGFGYSWRLCLQC